MDHKCGIIGIIGSNINITESLISGLQKLQHRGYESAGISFMNDEIITHKNIGLVSDVFKNFQMIPTNIGIGHVRYSTAKKDNSKFLEEAQPFSNSEFSIAHNGNIPFIQKIKEEYKLECNNNSDTYILTKFMEFMRPKYNNMDDLLKHIVDTITGAYALVIMTRDKLYAIRDRYGIRPLTLLKHKTHNAFGISSETIAFDKMDYDTIRDVNPGEIVSIDSHNGVNTVYQYSNPEYKFCTFEYIYFMHHESIKDGNLMQTVRFKLGYELGLSENQILDNNIVIPIPNSSIPASDGFAEAIKSIRKSYIIKNKNVGRTFILPTKKEREDACAKKFSFVDCHELENKNIYLIDDSIVRGTTIKYVVEQLKKFNPKSINIRITSPSVISPCYYGIDMATTDELIINHTNIGKITRELEISSLKYLNIDSMKNVLGPSICTSCFTGKYDKKLLDW